MAIIWIFLVDFLNNSMKYRLKRKTLNLYPSSLVNHLKGIGFFLFMMLAFYVVYYFIFFLFIGKFSVDVTIGFTIFLLWIINILEI